MAAVAPLPVTFFYPCSEQLKEDIGRVDRIDVDRDLEFWNTPQVCRRRIWNLQTYARLRDAGYDVAISETLPTEGIVLVLPEPYIMQAFRQQWTEAHRDLLICVMRADVVPFRFPFADAEILQNGRFADGERSFFIPHWPQPGLIPRDPSRGTRIRTITFKGDQANLHPDFKSARFHRFLEERGIEFIHAGPETNDERRRFAAWHDYSDNDLVLAMRKPWTKGGLRSGKPASKLVNAWHAGVPALLGPEYAYRELRRSPLDYIEIDSLDEAIDAVARLQDDPAQYRHMVERGRLRARAFTPARITERWAEVLFHQLPRLAKTSKHRLAQHLPLHARQVLNYVTMPPAPLEFKKQLGYVYRQVRQRVGG